MQTQALLMAIVIDADLKINRLPDFPLFFACCLLFASLLVHIPIYQRYNRMV